MNAMGLNESPLGGRPYAERSCTFRYWQGFRLRPGRAAGHEFRFEPQQSAARQEFPTFGLTNFNNILVIDIARQGGRKSKAR